MATIEELERRSVEIAEAESEAVRRLIDAMRDIAVGLPEGSQLAVRLAKYARLMEPYIGRYPQYATNEIHQIWKELRDDHAGEDES